MGTYSLQQFDELNIESLQEFYDGEIDLNGQQIDLDLNFEKESIDPQKLDIVQDFITNLEKYDSIAIQSIKQDYKSGDTVKGYIEQYFEELDEEDLSSIIDESDSSTSPEKQLLQKIHLKRVGFFPENKDLFAMFDYTINQELTDYYIIVNFKENGKIDSLDVDN